MQCPIDTHRLRSVVIDIISQAQEDIGNRIVEFIIVLFPDE